MEERLAGTLSIFLFLAFSSAASAEYLIYLKGGHYIIADNCTFSTRQEIGEADADQETVLVEDCAKGSPEGHIYWSTIDGKFGEIDANNVYAIYGSKHLTLIKPPRTSMPLEDYLITNRGESFVNAKIYEEKDTSVYGFKRDDLAKIDRRGLNDIAPEGVAKTRSGEGLCPGEPAEFSVSEVELVGERLVGVVKNLSKTPWHVRIDVEVEVKGKRLGKFQVRDESVLAPDESITIDGAVPARLVKYVERHTDREAGVRLCYRKVKTGAEKPAK